MSELRMIAMLLETMGAAIKSEDWVVDGACDPTFLMEDAEKILLSWDWRKDPIVGEDWIEPSE